MSHTLAYNIAFSNANMWFYSPFPFCGSQLLTAMKPPNVIAIALLLFELGVYSCSPHIHYKENMPRLDPSAPGSA